MVTDKHCDPPTIPFHPFNPLSCTITITMYVHEIVISFNIAVGSTLMVCPAIGFKVWHTDVRYRIPTAYLHLTTGSTIHSTMGLIRYLSPLCRWHTVQSRNKANFSLSHFTLPECEMEGLKLTASQHTCVWLDHVSCQLIGGEWWVSGQNNYAHIWSSGCCNKHWDESMILRYTCLLCLEDIHFVYICMSVVWMMAGLNSLTWPEWLDCEAG